MVTGTRLGGRCLGAAVGLLADRIAGEPPARVHPVANFGVVMTRVERAVYADHRAAGSAYAAMGALLGATVGAGAPTAAVVAVSAAGRMLRSCAGDVESLLARGDLAGARDALRSLAGRDPGKLDESGVAAAVVESLAENTVDAVVAPAMWGAALGAPAVAAHRAVNTMDAMVGHRTPRYAQFGWASARLDDVAAWVPARAAVALVCLARPGKVRAVLSAVRHDAPAHPSPNAGVAEAAFAGALGIELGGPLGDAGRHEERPRLGRGPRPRPGDISRAIRLAGDVELVLVALLAAAGATGRIVRTRVRTGSRP